MNTKVKSVTILLWFTLSFALPLVAEEDSRKELAKGWVDFAGAKSVPSGKFKQNPPNLRLVELAKKEVKLDIVNDIDLKDIALDELADLINSKIPSATNWKVIVSEEAKQLRTFGVLSNDLFSSLSPMLRRKDNFFYCRITDGVIEFKKGLSPSNIIPVEDSPLMQARDLSDVEVLTVANTVGKLNAKFNMVIQDARALNLIKLFEARVVKVDMSEVEETIKKRNIRVNMKAEKWIDVITNISDQIGANILICPGEVKLVPRK